MFPDTDEPPETDPVAPSISVTVPLQGVTAAAAVVGELTADVTKTPRRRWTKLDSIQVENFKAIGDATIPLGDVTILVGPNASGKSSALQAIHLSARAATYIAPKNTKEMIASDRLDYVPSSELLRVAHNGELTSDTKSKPVRVTFNHAAPSGGGDIAQVVVKIFAARNKGGISAHIEGGNAVSAYKQRTEFITAYIPGLAGLSEREAVLAQPQLRRQAASGDAGSVLRNVLYNLSSDRSTAGEGASRLRRLNELVCEVHPRTKIAVRFDEREDVNISASIEDPAVTNSARALETAATGILQVAQIFAYLVHFRPKIMLIDEPDSHLHPDKQERLIEALERAAREFDTQIILTTHSPHIVRAASTRAKLVWMHQGGIKTQDDETIRRLLGWGGLDRLALFFVEDEEDTAIRAIMGQWPELQRSFAVCRTFGVANLPRDPLLQGMLGSLSLKALVHRDGDFMTPADIARWEALYPHQQVKCWITDGSDVETYFCQPDYLAALYGVSLSHAEGWVTDAIPRVGGARNSFLNKRKEVIRILYGFDGGGESGESLWNTGPMTVRKLVGKMLWKQLKQVIKSDGFDEKRLERFEIPAGFEMAPDLKAAMQGLLA